VRGFGNGKGSTFVNDIASIDVVPADMRGAFHVGVNEMSDCIICASVAKGVVEDVEVSPVWSQERGTNDSGGDHNGQCHEIEDKFHHES